MDSPIAPRQRAIYFDRGDLSGATIGHHCTIVEIDPISQRSFPDEPSAWSVLVWVPHLQSYQEVDARDLLTADERDESELPAPAPPHLELKFVAGTRDQEQIKGKYRKGRWYWRDFVFAKADQPQPTWQLRGYVQGSRVDLGEVVYCVPRSSCLNRDYVVRAMTEIFRGQATHG